MKITSISESEYVERYELVDSSLVPYTGFTVIDPDSEALHEGDTSSDTSESIEVILFISEFRLWLTICDISKEGSLVGDDITICVFCADGNPSLGVTTGVSAKRLRFSPEPNGDEPYIGLKAFVKHFKQ